jgi:hypothetical protein
VEVPWLLGPPDGRYLIRRPLDAGWCEGAGPAHEVPEPAAPNPEVAAPNPEVAAPKAEGEAPKPEPTHVVLFATVSAERRRSRRSARQRTAPSQPAGTPEPPAKAVPVQRVTVIDASHPFNEEAAAGRWLAGAGEPELAGALLTIGSVLHTFSAVTADAHVRAPGRGELLVARIGFGMGEQLAYGQWIDARELLPASPRRKRAKVLVPQARLAAALGRRTPVLLCEDLVLRARSDLDADRARTAALQLSVALEAALSELQPQMAADMAARIAELAAQREAAVSAAAAALTGELSPAQMESVGFTLGRLEAALRARAAACAL